MSIRGLILAALAICLFAAPSNAAILVGTYLKDDRASQTSVTAGNIQELINQYNLVFGTNLASVNAMVGKIDAGQSEFPSGDELKRSDFNFYEGSSGSPDETLSIFGTDVDFDLLASNANIPNATPLAFEIASAKAKSDFSYYVAKDGNAGWSLWLAGDGLNPVYIDASEANLHNKDKSADRIKLTIGDISSTGIFPDGTGSWGDVYDFRYDNVEKAVSDISFWSASDGPGGDNNNPVPEPATMAIWSLMGVAGLVYYRRRRHAVK